MAARGRIGGLVRTDSRLPSGLGQNVRVSDLIDTTEMYLRTIYELVEEGIVPLRARIAERLHQSGPTVSQTVARMERDGLVTVEGDRHLELTDDGMAAATRVMRKHRLAERLLVDVIGLGWEQVHEEACRWEHVMSETVERRLLDLTASGRGQRVEAWRHHKRLTSRQFWFCRLGPIAAEPDDIENLTVQLNAIIAAARNREHSRAERHKQQCFCV